MELGGLKEITIRVSVTARPGTRFDAVAACAFAGEKFQADATDTGASAALAMANAVGRLLQAMQERHANFARLGPDVLLRKRSKRLRAELGEMFQHPDPPYKSAPYARPSYSLPPASSGAVRGELVDRTDDSAEIAAALGGDDDDDRDDDEIGRRSAGPRGRR